jgi:hypothetical protein
LKNWQWKLPDKRIFNLSTYRFEELKREFTNYLSRKEIPHTERAKIWKELACAMENIEALESELRTAMSQKEASDLEKAEMEEKLKYAVENIEILKSKLRS